MSENLQIIICPEGAIIYHPEAKGEEFILREELPAIGKKIAEFSLREGVKESNVILLVAEELLYYKTILLPANASDIKEAIGYQLSMVTPYLEEEIFYSYALTREKDFSKATLVATAREIVVDYIKYLTGAGYRLEGLFPETQRYVNRSLRKAKWALVMPGNHIKILVFAGAVIEERILCAAMPDFGELANLCRTEQIYLQPPLIDRRFLDATSLLDAKHQFKDLNMLPASLRRPDITKVLVKILVILNAIVFVTMVAGKEYRLRTLETKVEAEINQLTPVVKEVKKLQAKEKEILKYIEQIEHLGGNPNIIGSLDTLTKALPQSAYLDQVMIDKKQQALIIQGYANDIGELTMKLKQVGDAKLKSTSRRKEQNYFNVEITLP